jgi:hypothetical protein
MKVLSTHIYSVDIGHPSLQTLSANFRNFNGEDIECFNRKLAQATVSTSSRSNVNLLCLFYFAQVEDLHSRYKLLGILTCHSDWMRQEVSKYRSMKGFTDNEKHLNVNPTGNERKKV